MASHKCGGVGVRVASPTSGDRTKIRMDSSPGLFRPKVVAFCLRAEICD